MCTHIRLADTERSITIDHLLLVYNNRLIFAIEKEKFLSVFFNKIQA